MAQSIDQIQPADLAKINSYLDEVEISLSNFHGKKETKEIILILREQLFQQIELQSTLNQPFDIDAIIAKNRRDNQALITGNDRNEVVFSIKNPFKLSSKEKVTRSSNRISNPSVVSPKPQKSNKEENIEQIIPESTEFQNKKKLSQLLLYPLAILYILSVWIFKATTEVNTITTILFLSFTIVANIISNTPTSDWIKANIILNFGVLYYFGVSISVLEDTYLTILFPVYIITSLYTLFSSDMIFSDFSEFGKLNKFIYLVFFSTLFYILEAVLIYFVEAFHDDYIIFLSIILLITSIPGYFIVLRDRFQYWDLRLQGHGYQMSSNSFYNIDQNQPVSSPESAIEEPNKSTKKSQQETQSNNRPSVPEQYRSHNATSSLNASDLGELLGINSIEEKVELDMDMDRAHKLISFRTVTFVRVLLGLLIGGSMILIFFVSNMQNWTLRYYIDLLGLDNTYYGRYTYSTAIFRPKALLVLNNALQVFIGLLVIAYLFEVLKYFNRSDLRKIIPHLVLRQGTINVRSLSRCPPGVKPIIYYNQLGNLVMNGIVKLKHVGVKS